jgi:DNA invertase Pin-like site-specific DNA recombinase
MIFCYARTSTVEQAADGAASIPEQLRKGRALAQMRGMSAKDCVSFIDKGISGSTPLAFRPQGKEMLEAAQKGDCIVSSKMDRLFRSALDALQTAEELKARGVDLVLLDVSSDPVTGNGVGKMFFGIMACVAEFERSRINERTEEGRRGKRARRGFMGGGVPIGFKVQGKGREAQLEEDEREQAAIAKIKELLESKHQPGRIGRYLTKYYPTRSGRPWQCVQVQRIIAREGLNG